MSQNSFAKSFCVLPWVQMHIMPNSVVTPCCVSHYDDPYGDVSKQSFEEIWNGPKFTLLRSEMLKGIQPAGCSYCYKTEEAGFVSLRNSMNYRLKKDVKKALLLSDPDGTAELKLKAIDIRFSNICNFKCRSCSPALSSSWFEDYLALKKIDINTPKVRSIKTDSPTFWKEFHGMIGDLEYIYFGGGEPLITKEHFDLLRLLIERGQTNIDLVYNTNLSTLKYDESSLTDLWKHFRHVEIGVSVDDLGERAEYFRHGTRWATIVNNLKTIRDHHPNIECYINCTVSLVNVFYLPELFDYVISEKLINTNKININLVQLPWELCIDALPLHAKTIIKEKLEAYIENLHQRNINRYTKDFKNIIQQMMKIDNSHHFQEFTTITKKLDDLRGENFLTTYPELKSIFYP